MRQKILTLISNLRSHEGFLRYAKNTSWLMGEKVLRMFMGLFVGIWVARYLGPEQFGLLSYAQSFVFLFTAVASLGLDSIVVRELVRDSSQRDILLGTAFGLKLIGAVAVVPILWVAVQFTNNDSFTNFLIFITAGATIFQSFNVIDFYYQSTVMSKYVALTNTICLFLSSLIKVALIMNHASLVAFAWMGVFDAVVVMLGLVYFYVTKTRHKLVAWRFDTQRAKSLLKDSYPLIISSVMISLYMRIDQVMIKQMLDNNAVGQYAAAVRLSEVWYFIPMALGNSLLPAVLNAKKNSETTYYQRLKSIYFLNIWLSIFIATSISLFSGKIVTILYGEAYKQAISLVQISVWGGIFVALGIASNMMLIADNLQKVNMFFTTISTIINILLNIFLMQIYGVLGAAYSTVIAYALNGFLMHFFLKSTRKNFFIICKACVYYK